MSDLKDALASWATGISVVTTQAEGMLYGLTVSSFTSVSLDPPLVLVCLADSNRMARMIKSSRAFAVSLLASDQEAASRYFASPGREPTSGFVEIDGEWTIQGQAVVKDALAYLVCELEHHQEAGDHAIVIGRVVHAVSRSEKTPLVYWRRGYRRLPESD
jgi:flavin reductase (DIM6/NTAB) family NADH-FMN oxidoreductase RutF